MKRIVIILIMCFVFALFGSVSIARVDTGTDIIILPDKVVMTFDYKAAINGRIDKGFTEDDPLIQRWKELRIEKIKLLTSEQAEKYGILDEYEALNGGIPAVSDQAALDVLEQSHIIKQSYSIDDELRKKPKIELSPSEAYRLYGELPAPPPKTNDKYAVPGELVQIVDDLVKNAQTPIEFTLVVKMSKMISDPETITCGTGIDPNGKYNYGKSIYEVVSTDSYGNVLWKRTGYK